MAEEELIMVSRRSVMAASGIAGLVSLAPARAWAGDREDSPCPDDGMPAGFDTDPEAYDWLAVYKGFLSSLAADDVDLAPVIATSPGEAGAPAWGEHASTQASPMASPKGEAVKLAVKGASTTLTHIGRKAWERALSKVPLPGAVKKYLGYETVMKALNIAANFEGTVTDAITHGLKSVGVPGWAAGIAARAIVTVLL